MRASVAGHEPLEGRLAFAEGPTATLKRDLAADVLELFPYGVMVCERDGRIVAANRSVRELLTRAGQRTLGTCCGLLGCHGRSGPPDGSCLTELALERATRLPEIRLDVPAAPSGALWVTAAPLQEGDPRVVFELRPASPRDRRARTSAHWLNDRRIRIYSLGRFRVEAREASLSGAWLEQRAGQLLRLLVCERGRVVPTDVIAEAIWHNAGPAAPNTVRHFVHGLRERLEPGRPKHAGSSFVVCRHGGYELDRERVWIDADEFEQEARRGMTALAAGDRRSARERLGRAIELYGGDFLADEPYAEWTLAERERLRALAGSALRGLAELCKTEPEAAAGHLERLAELEPFDTDVQRELILAWLRLGRRSRALSRYRSFRLRLLREFGESPDFELVDLCSAYRECS
jgi:DNA-binding SARP family transcriptional activator